MVNIINGISNVSLGVSVLISVLGSFGFLLKGVFSRDSLVRASCFGAAKWAGVGFLVLLLLCPILLTIGLGFQANVTFVSAMSFFSLTVLSLIFTLVMMVRGYNEAA